jgi:hypothetical protein
MVRRVLSSALKEISLRNAAIAAAYRALAKRLPPGPVCKLASSIAEQRLELGKILGEVSVDRSLPESEVEFDVDPANLTGKDAFMGAIVDSRELLKKMAEAEAGDHELLAAVAGAVLPGSIAIAELLASEADSARKRSIWAQDHLDLLSMK